jgi:hypothetical protein
MALPQFDTQAFATNPQQWIQPYGQGLAGLAAQQLGRPIDTGAMTAGVAGPGAFTQAGQQLTADMGGLGDISRDATGQISGFTGGTGIASFQPYLQSIKDKGLLDPTGYQAYMSPYQQQVIDTTLAEFDKQAQIGKFGLGKSASDAGALHGIAQSEYQLGSDANRAAIQAGLLQGGFGQAQTLQQQGLQNLTGMAQLVPGLQQGLGQQFGAMGGQENTYAQALQNQMAAQNQMAMNYPMQRIGQAANIFGTTAGQVPGAPVQPFQGSGTYAGIGAFGNLQSLMGART